MSSGREINIWMWPEQLEFGLVTLPSLKTDVCFSFYEGPLLLNDTFWIGGENTLCILGLLNYINAIIYITSVDVWTICYVVLECFV